MRRHAPFTITSFEEGRARHEGAKGFPTAHSPNGPRLLEDAERQDGSRTLANAIQKMLRWLL